MTWRPPAVAYAQFQRNTIEAVVAQVRFLPILKVERDVTAFQDRVRALFPRFSSSRVRDVTVVDAEVQVNERSSFSFETLDRRFTVGLSHEDLSLSSRRHLSRAEFLGAADLAIGALIAEFQPVVTTRTGLRYINRIELDRVRRDLGEPSLTWGDLVHSDFARIPRDLADLQDTRFKTEVSSTFPAGELTLRYGLLREPQDQGLHFRLDLDRFLVGQLDASEVKPMLSQFATDIYAVFRAAATDTLIRWMQPIEGDRHV